MSSPLWLCRCSKDGQSCLYAEFGGCTHHDDLNKNRFKIAQCGNAAVQMAERTKESPDDHHYQGDKKRTRFALEAQRPLITPQLRQKKPVQWARLFTEQPRHHCLSCRKKPKRWDGPMLSGIPTRCNHFACEACWEETAKRDKCCPICGEDVTSWLELKHPCGIVTTTSGRKP